MKRIFLVLLCAILSYTSFSQSFSVSSGVLYSDITTWYKDFAEGNDGKFGYYTSINYQKKVWK